MDFFSSLCCRRREKITRREKTFLSLFISRFSVSLSCNLCCRFLHHHYSRCSFMSDSERETERNPCLAEWVTLDGNVRITQLGNSEITLMKMLFFRSPMFCLVFGWGLVNAKPKQIPIFFLVRSATQITNFLSYVFRRNMHARHLKCYSSSCSFQ